MTIDKIEHYMDEDIFKYWTVEFREICEYDKQIEILDKAINKLQKEINSGILNDIKYHAELRLLKHLRD